MSSDKPCTNAQPQRGGARDHIRAVLVVSRSQATYILYSCPNGIEQFIFMDVRMLNFESSLSLFWLIDSALPHHEATLLPEVDKNKCTASE